MSYTSKDSYFEVLSSYVDFIPSTQTLFD